MPCSRLPVHSILVLGTLAAACGSTDQQIATDATDATDADGGDGPNPGATSQFAPGAVDPCPDMQSPYLNDELCVEPPPTDMGFQIHFGPPAGSDYDNPDAIAPYLLDPSQEEILCAAFTTPNTDVVYSQEHHIRSRSGTHHLIYWRGIQSPAPDGTLKSGDEGGCRDGQFFVGAEAALGPEGGILDVPIPGVDPPDNLKGVAMVIQPKTAIWLETHFINTTPDPILREVWANFIYKDPSTVTEVMDPIAWFGGLTMDIPPHTQQSVQGGPVDADAQLEKTGQEGPIQILGLAGHDHAHATRFSVQLNHADGTQDLIYDMYNWAEPLFAEFDSAHDNPPTGTGMDGAHTGDLLLKPGDNLTYQCDIDNTLDTNITFADRTYDAEMCCLFGYYKPGNGGAWESATP
jgi:hypothetical protein